MDQSKERKSKIVTTRLTAELYSAVKEAAGDQPISDYLRGLIEVDLSGKDRGTSRDEREK